jgi:bis(5'-adenosyl)-triphosphatase
MASSTAPALKPGDAKFGKFVITSDCIFFRSDANSLAFVNLRPIVPGHVLVIPERVVSRMMDLDEAEYIDLWKTVRTVQSILQKQHEGIMCSFNVAVQDGVAAGQSVPHVHVHILPRTTGDYERNDDIYQDLEEWAPRTELRHSIPLNVPDDEERRDRTRQEMAEEAANYRTIADKLMKQA